MPIIQCEMADGSSLLNRNNKHRICRIYIVMCGVEELNMKHGGMSWSMCMNECEYVLRGGNIVIPLWMFM